jgi:hypothetical protein
MALYCQHWTQYIEDFHTTMTVCSSLDLWRICPAWDMVQLGSNSPQKNRQRKKIVFHMSIMQSISINLVVSSMHMTCIIPVARDTIIDCDIFPSQRSHFVTCKWNQSTTSCPVGEKSSRYTVAHISGSEFSFFVLTWMCETAIDVARLTRMDWMETSVIGSSTEPLVHPAQSQSLSNVSSLTHVLGMQILWVVPNKLQQVNKWTNHSLLRLECPNAS